MGRGGNNREKALRQILRPLLSLVQGKKSSSSELRNCSDTLMSRNVVNQLKRQSSASLFQWDCVNRLKSFSVSQSPFVPSGYQPYRNIGAKEQERRKDKKPLCEQFHGFTKWKLNITIVHIRAVVPVFLCYDPLRSFSHRWLALTRNGHCMIVELLFVFVSFHTAHSESQNPNATILKYINTLFLNGHEKLWYMIILPYFS